MKKKLSALLAALILTLTALMTGCGGIATTNKLKLSDYAVPVSEAAQQGIAASVRPKPEMIFAGNDYSLDDENTAPFTECTTWKPKPWRSTRLWDLLTYTLYPVFTEILTAKRM